MNRSWVQTAPGASVALLLILAAALLQSPGCRRSRNRTELARRVAAAEGEAENDRRIKELEAEIRGLDRQVEKSIDAVRKKGTYWRLLGLKYMDYSMWGEAMAAFDEALAIYPEHAALLYNRSLSAGQMALSELDPEGRTAYIDQAEAGYRRALVLDPRFTPAMYALAVVLVFEKGRPEEAIMYLEDFLKIERSDTSVRFLLARAYLDAGRAGDALSVYEYLIENSRAGDDRSKAEDLYRRVTEGDYGN